MIRSLPFKLVMNGERTCHPYQKVMAIASCTRSPVLFINGEGQDAEGEYECIVFKDGQCLCMKKQT